MEEGSLAPTSDRKVILIVDDDPSVRAMLRRVLVSEGYSVVTAPTAREAFELTRAQHVDLVLLDLNMPGQGGWEVFAKLSSLDPLLAVIIITARPSQLFTALAAGVDALLEKPFDYGKMLETVRIILEEPASLRRKRVDRQDHHLRYVATGTALPR